ncbi:hypothetical protein [Teredinibacter haidensis]|uniref:hypothetical protein n=1 Tax=Teredinibacter haidensis TaxID=2731755 RepID=UPI000AE1AAC3|nr:hypothetical protein [Teredinibacter haidensis]
MRLNSLLKIGSVFGLGVGLIACGGSGQDVGSPSHVDTVLSGRVIDGYLARATVFMDTNNNGTRDAWEPFAFTDDEGYYSYNPNTDTDYCAADASAALQQYCLRLNTVLATAVIRVDGGYDVQTGEPFIGQLSRRVDINTEVENDFIVTPITTLLTSIDGEENQHAVLNRLGLNAPDLDVDYLHNDSISPQLINTALTIHKSVTILSDALTDTYFEIGENLGTPNDASQLVYKNLAEFVLAGEDDVETLLASEGTLLSVLENTEDELRSIYTLRELDLPADMGSPFSPGAFERTVEHVVQVPNVVDHIINIQQTVHSADELEGAVRLLETIVVKNLNENGGIDTTIENAINFVTNSDNAALLVGLTESLGENNAFVSELVNNDFFGDDFDTVEDFQQAVSLPEGAEAFSALAGKKVHLSDPDLGQAPNDLKDIEVAFFFSGEQGAVSGSIKACAKYIDGASSEGSLGEGNTRGELVEGFWTLLGATADNNESYSVLLTMTFLGATYQSIIKPAGTLVVDGQERYALRFDFDGDIRDWHTENGFEENGVIPQTAEDCEELLPSRVGI